MEKWKSIDGFNGIFQISNFGRLRKLSHTVEQKNKWGGVSLATYEGWVKGPVFKKERAITVKGGGYYHYNTFFCGKQIFFDIHREVAKAFVPNPENKPTVNHIDGDKHNNRAENLEWVTEAEQMAHAVFLGLTDYGSTRNSKISKSRKGRRWFTNGKTEICVFPENCPSGWKPGRSYRRQDGG